MPNRIVVGLLLSWLPACVAAPVPGGEVGPPVPVQGISPSLGALEREIRALLPADDTLEISIAVRDLATGDSLLIDAHVVMHAASTMKVPVMLELMRRVDAGELQLRQPVRVMDEFVSIADGSRYTLTPADDSDRSIYESVGREMPMVDLMERMIVRSSNLATNILIALAAPERIAATLSEIGATGVTVLRGVEDGPAFRAGMNNTTTAYGMMRVFEAIVDGRGASPDAGREMLRILEGQEFQETIPAGLPQGVRVGNKTGWITGINHDAAVVLPEDRAPYVMVFLTRGFRDRGAAQSIGSAASAAVYRQLAGGSEPLP